MTRLVHGQMHHGRQSLRFEMENIQMGGWNAGLATTQAPGDSNTGYLTDIEDVCIIVDRDSVRSRRHDRSRVAANGRGPILSSSRCLSCFVEWHPLVCDAQPEKDLRTSARASTALE